MEIRAERAEDVEAIARLVAAAFADAEHASGTEAAIVDALRRDGALRLSLVAAEGEDLVGHVAFSPVRIDGQGPGWIGLGPLAVRPDRQRRGIGAALVRAGLDRIEAEGARGCVLVGDPAFYSRFGFRSDGRLRFGDVPSEYVQWITFGRERPAGAIFYPPSFGAGQSD